MVQLEFAAHSSILFYAGLYYRPYRQPFYFSPLLLVLYYLHAHDCPWYSPYVDTYIRSGQIVAYLIYLTVYHGRVFHALLYIEIGFFLFVDG